MTILIHLKRVYDDPSEEDGYRLLVDRLWPRGITKVRAKIDLWPKELTPSNVLRKWFHNHLDQHAEFVKRYLNELAENRGAIDKIIGLLPDSAVTLVTATADFNAGHVATLKSFLELAIAKQTTQS